MPVLPYASVGVAELLISTPEGKVLANRKLDATRAYWIGRESICDVIVDSVSVSRRHALVFQSNGRWYASDAGSMVGLQTEAGAVRFALLSADTWVKVGSVYVWLAGGSSAIPDWNDAQPDGADPTRPVRFVRLTNEDRTSSATATGSEALVVSDCNGRVHLCADLSGLASTAGSGVPRLVIGRSTAADLQICDPSVDPLHAVLALGNEHWSLIDAGSSCGIMFEGKRWFRKRLENGITLPVGNYCVSVQPIARTTAPLAPEAFSGHLERSKDEERKAQRRPSAFLPHDDERGDDEIIKL